MGKKNNTKKNEVLEQKQDAAQEQEVTEKAEPKYVNPVLGWGLILAEIAIAAGIAAIIILPLL